MEFVWADSLGAKSYCLFIEAGNHRVIVDPGIAVMHPTYPAPLDVKRRLYKEGYERVREYMRLADIVVITHYHYDHYLHRLEDIELYRGKTVLAKNPNNYINDSQRKRAEEFYSMLYSRILGSNLEEIMLEPVEEEYPDTMNELVEALRVDYGDYTERKKQLLEQGRKWFNKRRMKWISWKRIPEVRDRELTILFADNRVFDFGDIRIAFSKPLFHGIEYSRVGWIISAIIHIGNRKIYYTSDVNGPIIEDYASMIIREDPEILVLDGPPTYTLGYMLNNINLNRAVRNGVRIIKETSRLKTMFYDHHLTREPLFRERTKPVWDAGSKENIRVITVAEHYGKVPVVLVYGGGKD